MSSNPVSHRFSTRNKVGLVLTFLLGVTDLPSFFEANSASANTPGPPASIMILDGICGVITVVAVIWVWRSLNRGAVRLAAGARIVSMVSALPAFFVDVPAGLKVAVAVFVVLTSLAVALMLAPARNDATVPETVAS